MNQQDSKAFVVENLTPAQRKERAKKLTELKHSLQMKDCSDHLLQRRKLKFFTHEQRSFAVWAWGGREIAVIDLTTMAIIQVIKSGRQARKVDKENGDGEERKAADADQESNHSDVERDIFGEPVGKQDDLQTIKNSPFEGINGEDIECIDVATFSKDIVAYGTTEWLDYGEKSQCLVIYGLEDMTCFNGMDPSITSQITRDTGYKNLQRPSKQQLRWFAYWKITGDMMANQGFVSSVGISPFGDMFTLGGNGFFTVWSRDQTLIDHSYSLHLLYGKDLPKKIFAQNKQEIDLGQIVQVEYADDGRSFATLEQDNETLKRRVRIWYNRDVDSIFMDAPSAQLSMLSTYQGTLELKSLFGVSGLNPSLDLLNHFEVPEHRSQIAYFTYIRSNYEMVEAQNHGSPSIRATHLLTVTEDGEAHLWSEEMTLQPDFLQAPNDFQAPPVAEGEEAQDQQPLFEKPTAFMFTRSCSLINRKFKRSMLPSIQGVLTRGLVAPLPFECTAPQKMTVFRSPMLYGKHVDHIYRYKVLQSEKAFPGMGRDRADGGTGREILHVLALGQQYVHWEIRGCYVSDASKNPTCGYEVTEVSKDSVRDVPADAVLFACQDTSQVNKILEKGPSVSDELCLYGLKRQNATRLQKISFQNRKITLMSSLPSPHLSNIKQTIMHNGQLMHLCAGDSNSIETATSSESTSSVKLHQAAGRLILQTPSALVLKGKQEAPSSAYIDEPAVVSEDKEIKQLTDKTLDVAVMGSKQIDATKMELWIGELFKDKLDIQLVNNFGGRPRSVKMFKATELEATELKSILACDQIDEQDVPYLPVQRSARLLLQGLGKKKETIFIYMSVDLNNLQILAKWTRPVPPQSGLVVKAKFEKSMLLMELSNKPFKFHQLHVYQLSRGEEKNRCLGFLDVQAFNPKKDEKMQFSSCLIAHDMVAVAYQNVIDVCRIREGSFNKVHTITTDSLNGLDFMCLGSLDIKLEGDELVLLVNGGQKFRHPLGFNPEAAALTSSNVGSILSTDSLKKFFMHSKVSFVFGVLGRLHQTLAKLRQEQQPAGTELPAVELLLGDVLKEIEESLGGQAAEIKQQEPEVPKKTEEKKAINDFFGGSDSDDDGDLLSAKPAVISKKDEKKVDVILDDSQYKKIREELQNNLAYFVARLEASGCSREQEQRLRSLLEFVLLFNKIYGLDFYSDAMATTLLKGIHLKIQKHDENQLKELLNANSEAGAKKRLEPDGPAAGKVNLAGMTNAQIYAHVYGLDDEGGGGTGVELNDDQVEISQLGSWNSRQVCLAMFSVDQDEIMNELEKRFAFSQVASWDWIRRISMPIWHTDTRKLRDRLEAVAKIAQRVAMNQRPAGGKAISIAESGALYFILMNKKDRLIALYKQEAGGEKVANLLMNNFDEKKHADTAVKNAKKLHSLKRHLLALTFYLLGKDIKSAMQITLRELKDPALSILVCRMMILQWERDEKLVEATRTELNKIYEEEFIKRGKTLSDVYLISMGLWGQQKYIQALNALQGAANTDDLTVPDILSQNDKLKFQEGAISDKVQTQFPLPTRHVGPEVFSIVARLRKAPLVQAQLRQQEGTSAITGYGADANFDDFFADSSATKEEEKKDEQVVEKVFIEIEEKALLNQVIKHCLLKGNVFHAIFVLREHQDLLSPEDLTQVDLIVRVFKKILLTQMAQSENAVSETLQESVDKLIKFVTGHSTSETILVEPSKLTQDNKLVLMARIIFRKTINGLIKSLQKLNVNQSHLLRFEIDLRLDAQRFDSAIPWHQVEQVSILNRFEQFNDSYYDIVLDRLNKAAWSKDCDQSQVNALLKELEQLIDVLVIFDSSQNREGGVDDAKAAWTAESLEMWFYTLGQKAPVEEEKKPEQEKPQPKKDAVANFFGDDDDDSDDDLFAMSKKQAAKKEVKPAAPKGPSPPNLSKIPKFQKQSQLAIFAQKLRLVVNLSLLIVNLGLQCGKFSLMKDMVLKLMSSDGDLLKAFTSLKKVDQFKARMNNAKDDTERGNIAKEADEALAQDCKMLSFVELKMYILKLKTAFQTLNQHDRPQYELDLYQADQVTATTLYQKLVQQKQLGQESYEFMQMWLKYIIVDRVKQSFDNIFVTHSAEGTMLNYQNIMSTKNLMNIDVKLDKQAGWDEQMKEVESYLFKTQQQSSTSKTFDLDSVMVSLKSLHLQMQRQCNDYFTTRLNVLQKKFIAREVSATAIRSDKLFDCLLQYFFKTHQKMEDFWKAFEVPSKYGRSLNDYYLTVLGRSNTGAQFEFEALDQMHVKNPVAAQADQKAVPGKSPNRKTEEDGQASYLIPATQQLTMDLLGAGIEIFKQKSEQVSDFAFDNSSATNNMALGLMTSGIREFPLQSTLEFRNRRDNGLCFVDEENLKWEECLHRYEAIESLVKQNGQQAMEGKGPGGGRTFEIFEGVSEPIVMSIDSLFAEKTMFNRCHGLKPEEQPIYAQAEASPPGQWNGVDSCMYLRATSRLDISHEDPTYALSSHPHLPLYFTGNRAGILCTWRFGQQEDKSLNQFMPEVDPREADIKKACINKIRLNNYGDKIMSSNGEGCLTIYQVECMSKAMRKLPIFSLSDSAESRINDFDLVNGDNVVCTLTQKKSLCLYDTLLPYGTGRQACIMEVKKTPGNIVLCNQRTQTIYTFNGRTGAMTELDMRKNLQQIAMYQLSESHEITAACLSQSHDSLITGYKDGHLKIHRVANNFKRTSELSQDSQTLPLREKIKAFPYEFKGKKGLVTSIKINKKNGGLFASSQAGVLKLIRTSV